ncbi:ComF family protein [Massilia sp. W12]|uniref:ComF family protein n=1 Tax=Massilia sp. W12 TaxID=3126507 RepID=UPI0030D2D9C1
MTNRALRFLRSTWQACAPALDFFLPSCCALCGCTARALLCADCQQFLSQDTPRCRICALPLSEHETAQCGACLAHPPHFDATIAACAYAAPQDRLVLALKFGAKPELGAALAPLLRDAILRAPQQDLPDLLCAAPLGSQRLRERGYNQALEIARPLAQLLGAPLAPGLLLRVRETQAQSALSYRARRRNLRRAFLPAPESVARIAGLHIGVVDDVMTSGQTLNEIARVLRRYGAARVSNYVFARTPRHA